MTREEAIKILENGGWWDLLIPITTIEGRSDEDKLHQAIDMAISALRSVSREQVEMAWRGEWGIGGTEMTDREKMIDLIINAKKSDPETGSFTEYLADFLLGYGIKLPDPTPQPGNPLTLEQLRERWKGCDSCKAACWNCSHNLLCRASNDEKCHNCFDQSRWEYNNYRNYCPECGRPLTDGAWVQLAKRLEGLKDAKAD